MISLRTNSVVFLQRIWWLVVFYSHGGLVVFSLYFCFSFISLIFNDFNFLLSMMRQSFEWFYFFIPSNILIPVNSKECLQNHQPVIQIIQNDHWNHKVSSKFLIKNSISFCLQTPLYILSLSFCYKQRLYISSVWHFHKKFHSVEKRVKFNSPFKAS